MAEIEELPEDTEMGPGFLQGEFEEPPENHGIDLSGYESELELERENILNGVRRLWQQQQTQERRIWQQKCQEAHRKMAHGKKRSIGESDPESDVSDSSRTSERVMRRKIMPKDKKYEEENTTSSPEFMMETEW